MSEDRPKPEARSGASASGQDGAERRGVGRRRLSIEVSPDLHRRILTICATRRIPVNQAVREVLERAFPG